MPHPLFLEKALDKLKKLEASSLSSQGDEARALEIKACIRAIEKCRNEIDTACEWYHSQIREG